jgi:hypothetical protein
MAAAIAADDAAAGAADPEAADPEAADPEAAAAGAAATATTIADKVARDGSADYDTLAALSGPTTP